MIRIISDLTETLNGNLKDKQSQMSHCLSNVLAFLRTLKNIV